jgi:leader peptidase (prepilin peptidase)/N-methyltransferase
MPVLIAAVALLGLAIGSFLNVVIYRLPLHMSLSRPPSQCPRCNQPIRARHNMPLLGWLWLRGKCADCKAPISIRYPFVELMTGALFVAVTLRMDALHRLSALPAYLAFTALAVVLTWIDVDVHRLPNSLVLPSYPVIALLLTIAAVIQGEPSSLLRMLVGGLALFAFYYALAFCYPAGMGGGDVKLSGVIGGTLAFFSYPALLIAAFSAFVLGGVGGIAILLAKRGTRKSKIPFGPFMLCGAFIGIFAGAQLARLYSDLMFNN